MPKESRSRHPSSPPSTPLLLPHLSSDRHLPHLSLSVAGSTPPLRRPPPSTTMGNAGDIPAEQRAAVKQGSGADATAPLQTVKVPEPEPHQILVRINWTGLCASDKSLIHDEWADFGLSMQPSTNGIAGHEGAGTVVSVGSAVQNLWKPGDRAGVKWVVSVCRECEFCTNGTDELQCPKQLNSGFTAPGTFQEYVVTDGRYATRIPEGVRDEEAGPIMCGGVTAYTACKRASVRPGQWCVMLGAGGGLGHFGVQYGRAMGMRVIAVGEYRDAVQYLRRRCRGPLARGSLSGL